MNKKVREPKKNIDKMSVILDIQKTFSSANKSNEIYNSAGKLVCDLFDIQRLEISVYDQKNNILFEQYKYKEGEHPSPMQKYAPSGFHKDVFEKKKLLIINNVISNEEFNNGSTLYIPIVIKDMTAGVMTLYSDEENFTKSDIKFIQVIVSTMATALETFHLSNDNALLEKEINQRNMELSILNAIQQGLVMEMDFHGIIYLVGDKLREALNYQDIGIRIYDKEKNLIYFPYEFEHGERLLIDPLPPGGISGYVIKTGNILIIRNNEDESLKKLGIEGLVTLPGTDRSKSLIAVPILVNNEVRGLITVENYEKEDAFSDSDVRLLKTLANSMSIALENARLFEETKHLLKESEQRTAELSILNSIQQGLVMEMSFEGIINLVGDKLREALNYRDIGIRIYDKKTDLFYYPYEYEHGQKLEIKPTRPGPISGWILKNKKMIHVRKDYSETLKSLGIEGITTIPGTEQSKSLIVFPILAGEQVRGLFAIENYEKEDAFSESDIRLFTTLASSMNIALENARLFEETKRLLNESNKREAELITVNNISQALTVYLEFDKLIDYVGNKIRELFNAQIIYLALLDRETNTINFPYGYGDEFPAMSLGEGLTSKIILTGKPLLINKRMDEIMVEMGINRVGIPASSYLGVPIPIGDKIIGVISIQSTEQENAFNEDDMRLLNTIAANIGVALNNADAYQKLNSTVNQLNKALNDLKATQQQLIVQEKLASLGTLTAGIAHEIKNPLNFVNNFAENSIELANELKEELGKALSGGSSLDFENVNDLLKELIENAKRINTHGKRADSIVRNMLLHSRGKPGERQVIDINAMIEEDLNLAYHGMRARDGSFNLTIEKDFDNTIDKISIVPQDISRVFINIINNGFYELIQKKISAGDNFKPVIVVSTKNKNETIEIHIRDNGNGIPVEIHDKLFSPFFTTKPTGEGTGLGLSLSYDIIVKQHRGDIRFNSKMGEFTEFIISLPKNNLI